MLSSPYYFYLLAPNWTIRDSIKYGHLFLNVMLEKCLSYPEWFERVLNRARCFNSFQTGTLHTLKNFEPWKSVFSMLYPTSKSKNRITTMRRCKNPSSWLKIDFSCHLELSYILLEPKLRIRIIFTSWL